MFSGRNKGYIFSLTDAFQMRGLRTLSCQWFLRQQASLNVLDTVADAEPLDSERKVPVVKGVDIVN